MRSINYNIEGNYTLSFDDKVVAFETDNPPAIEDFDDVVRYLATLDELMMQIHTINELQEARDNMTKEISVPERFLPFLSEKAREYNKFAKIQKGAKSFVKDTIKDIYNDEIFMEVAKSLLVYDEHSKPNKDLRNIDTKRSVEDRTPFDVLNNMIKHGTEVYLFADEEKREELENDLSVYFYTSFDDLKYIIRENGLDKTILDTLFEIQDDEDDFDYIFEDDDRRI